MWSTLTDNLPQVIGAASGVTALVAAWLRLRPRRIVGWLSAVKEREMLLAMLEHERQWGLYWKGQADQCFDRLRELTQ